MEALLEIRENPMQFESEAESCFENQSYEECFLRYYAVCQAMDDEYLKYNPAAIRRAIQVADILVEKTLHEGEIVANIREYAEAAVNLLDRYITFFTADENGDIQIEIGDVEFLRNFARTTRENRIKIWTFVDAEIDDEAIDAVFEVSTDSSFIYLAGLVYEKKAGSDVEGMEKYGKRIASAYEKYLFSVIPMDADNDKILHAHAILDYYYGFGYGVEKNLILSEIHEKTAKELRSAIGKNKAANLAELMKNISNAGK